jgi:hypothetical protein
MLLVLDLCKEKSFEVNVLIHIGPCYWEKCQSTLLRENPIIYK